MKIQYEIAGGHKRGPKGLNEYIEANPAKTKSEASAEWIAAKFGAWITTNISEDFVIADEDSNGFTVDFTYEDDATAFREKLGGRVLEA